MPTNHAGLWRLDSGVAFLNHGSFGACPVAVLDAQAELRDEMERQPVEFFVRRLPARIDAAREVLAGFLGADPAGLVAVSNATGGVNAVLRSLELRADDELLTTDHEYNACRNALEFVAQRFGAKVVVARLPFPAGDAGAVFDAVMQRVTPRTRLALVDHVTSPTGMILPLERLVPALESRGIEVLVDGAHAPGMLPLELASLGATYYTGNCHKWICAPKGAGFLWVAERRRDAVRPLTISHGANTRRPGRSRLHDEFDWRGTDDPTAFLCVPLAIEHLEREVDGGWPAIREHNHRLVVEGRRVVQAALGVTPPCPEAMLGSLASLPLADGSPEPPSSPLYADPLQDRLLRDFRVEVPIVPWPAPPRRLLRISAQLYNSLAQYEQLAAALVSLGAAP